MALKQSKRISELTALESASLQTTLVGVDNGTTYKVTLDVLEDAIINMVSRSTDLRLDALEAYTASVSASSIPLGTISSSAQISNFGFISSSHTDITSLNSFTSSQNTLNSAFTNGINARLQTSSFNEFSASVHTEILAATNEQSFNGLISGSSQLTSSFDVRYSLSGSIANIPTGSFATTGSNTFYGNQNISGSLIVSGSLVASSTFVNNSNIQLSGSDLIIDDGNLSISGSINVSGSVIVSSTFINNAILQLSGSDLIIDGGDIIVTGSVYADNLMGLISSSAQITDLGFISSSQTIDTGSFATTGSNTFNGTQTISGSLNFSSGSIINGLAQYSGAILLQPVTDPDPLSQATTGTHIFVSSSNNQTGEDLYFRQQDNKVKWKWLEGKLNTGILTGGAISYSGSLVYVKAGTGIIVNHNASLTEEVSPVTTYVYWNDYTASCQNVTSSLVTYLYADNGGTIHQTNSYFTVTQYRTALPLGMVNHTGKNVITSVANNVATAYDDVSQTSDFIRAFGPMKLSGLTMSAATDSLKFTIEAGTSYILGGFYQQDPNNASHKETTLIQTGSLSIARVKRDGAGSFIVDNNSGSFYNSIDSDYWDDGTGTLNTMSTGDWQIQRVFFNPFTNRCHIYYGQSVYSSFINAKQYLATDPFVEADYTSHQYVFLGYLIVKGQTNNLADTNNNVIVQSGLFRNTVGSSGGVQTFTHLHDLADVEVAGPTDKDILSYNSANGLWEHHNATYLGLVQTASFNSYTASISTGSLVSSITNLNSFTASAATTGSNIFRADQTISGSLFLTGSVTTKGNVFIGTGSAAEGGEIQLAYAQTGNTSLTGSMLVVDIWQDRLRMFENSGNNRGAYLNVASQSNSVGSSIVTSPNLLTMQTITSASYAAITPVSGTLYIIIG